MTTHRIVLIRHGESEWNKLNKFCGWFDSDLSEKGVEEAHIAGKVSLFINLSETNFKFILKIEFEREWIQFRCGLYFIIKTSN